METPPVSLSFDPDVDAFYADFRPDSDVRRGRQIVVDDIADAEIVLDIDDEGRLAGLEVLGASILFSPEFLAGCRSPEL